MPIRPATPEDVPAILPMVGAVCRAHAAWDPARYATLGDVEERYRRWLPERAADPRSVLLVATARAAGLAPVGFLVASMAPTVPIYTVRETGFVHDLWVEPRFRRMGLARELVRACVARFAEIGAAQVRLETAAANGEARRLFESEGFRVSSVEMLRELAG